MTEIEIPPYSFIELFKNIKGAFSVTEGIALYNICQQVPSEGIYVEAGSHKCKSTLASLLAFNGSNDFYLLEPEFENIDFLVEAQKAIVTFKQEFSNGIKCHFIPEYSTDFFQNDQKYSYVMIDSGDHGEDLVQAEKILIEDKIVSGGILAMHDLNNQFTAVRRMYDQLLSSGKYEEVVVDWDVIIKYVKENNLEEGNNSWHIYEETPYPNFVGALKRK